MKAAVYYAYGPPEVLQLQEVKKPVPKDNEVQIRIFSTAVNSADWRLRKAKVGSRQKVFVYGASGAVGTAAVQLAKYFGAEVTAICSSADIEMVKLIGADRVLDYTKDDFIKNGGTYDVVIETVDKLPYSDCMKLLKKNGILILSVAGFSQMLRGAVTSITGKRKVITGGTKETADDMQYVKELIDNGFYKQVIDRTYTLDQIVEAHRYGEQGHKKGNVAIRIIESD